MDKIDDFGKRFISLGGILIPRTELFPGITFPADVRRRRSRIQFAFKAGRTKKSGVFELATRDDGDAMDTKARE